MVSILGEYSYEFPKPFTLEKRLKDYLEDNVDEKYYIKDYDSTSFINDNYSQLNGGKWEKLHDIGRRVYSTNFVSPTIHTMGGGNLEPKIVLIDDNFITIPEATEKGYAEARDGDDVYINRPHQKRGVVQNQMIQTLKTSGDDIGVVVNGNNYSDKSIEKIRANITDVETLSKTITANPQRATIDSATLVRDNLRIRKLIPLECWRLMGIDDECFHKAEKVCSNSQLYKQAGNGIVVDVFAAIVKNLI